MAIEIYRGKYISADDATKVIDMPTINDGCRMLKDASDRLERLTKKIDLLRETCSKEAISIDGSSMEELIEHYEKLTNDFSLYISDLSDALSKTTQRVVNRKQTILNEEARRLDDKEALLHEGHTSSAPVPDEMPLSDAGGSLMETNMDTDVTNFDSQSKIEDSVDTTEFTSNLTENNENM